MVSDKQSKIIVVGIGPGGKQFVLPAATAAMEKARILVGGRRVLADFAQEGQKTFPVTADIAAVLDFIRRELNYGDVTVAVSGDPGYFSLLDALRQNFSPDIISTIPGISSLQCAFARLSLPWHDAVLLSFHGREPTGAQLLAAKGKILGMLTDGQRNSQTIAALLLKNGWQKETPLVVLERLSYDDEKITRTTLQQAAQNPPVGHCILIVEPPNAAK